MRLQSNRRDTCSADLLAPFRGIMPLCLLLAHSMDYGDHCLQAGPVCSAWGTAPLRCLSASYLFLMFSCKSCRGQVELDMIYDLSVRTSEELHQSQVQVLNKFGFHVTVKVGNLL